MSGSDSTQLEEQAQALLRRHLGARAGDIRIVARDGGVVLRGRACSYYAKQLAQHVVMQVLRLLVVANEIEVRWAVPMPDSGGDTE
jgi:osmotically-inducible protein OsmY